MPCWGGAMPCWGFLRSGRALDKRFTAANYDEFPKFEANDKKAICFNLKPRDVPLNPDPYFQWQGTYFQLSKDGQPIEPTWRDALKVNASDEGVKLIGEYCKSKLKEGDEVFYSPAKAKRWGVKGPDQSKPTNMENLLIKRERQWIHVEVSKHEEKLKIAEFGITEDLLSRITYLSFTVGTQSSWQMKASAVYGDKDPSQAAWLWGSSLILEGQEQDRSLTSRVLPFVPSVFEPVRFVPLDKREAFINVVASTPTVAITGATVEKNSAFASRFSTEIGKEIGSNFSKNADQTGVRVMINGSMKGHLETMCADDDFSSGFEAHAGCRAVSVKGLNMVRLHGDAWKVASGTQYVLQEKEDDFSNHAKEACITAAASNPKSIVITANGGPTVSINLSRFLVLSSRKRVFSINGMHSDKGTSGAAGCFKAKEVDLEKAVNSLTTLSTDFFTNKVKKGKALIEELKQKPLTLLELDQGGDGKCKKGEYILQPEKENTNVSPGISDANLVSPYCKAAVDIILQQIKDSEPQC